MFNVYDNSAPAIIWGNEEWSRYKYHTLAGAQEYLAKWLGHLAPSEAIVANERFYYNGYGDFVEIVEETTDGTNS